MIKRNRCEEVVTGNGATYKFSGTLANVEALSFVSGDPGELYTALTDGKMPPTDIKNALTCMLVEVGGKPVADAEIPGVVDTMIEDFGLQECSILVRLLLSHAIIGTIKKKRIERSEAPGKVLSHSRSMISRFHGWQWATAATVLIISVCMISSTQWQRIG